MVDSDTRVAALRQFRDTGTLPEGLVAWNDKDREPLTDPSIVDWLPLNLKEKYDAWQKETED
jgi:hypothetical protein